MKLSELFGPDGKLLYLESPYDQDFKFVNNQTECRGILYNETKRSFVFLGKHESLAEIFDSCEHESIHCAIRHKLDDDSTDASGDMDVDEEHNLMRFLKFAKDGLVFDQ